MKKTFIIALSASLVLMTASCQRTSIDDPTWSAPAGFHIMVDGSVTPALQLIDGRIHTSEVYIRVTDYAGTPLPNKTVFLEQLADASSYQQLSWGYFPNNQSTYQRGTDANGEIRVTFFWPTQYFSEEMYIHALLVIDGRAYKTSETGYLGNIPQDFISLTMYRAGGAASETTK
jgi:hypothetical protein